MCSHYGSSQLELLILGQGMQISNSRLACVAWFACTGCGVVGQFEFRCLVSRRFGHGCAVWHGPLD